MTGCPRQLQQAVACSGSRPLATCRTTCNGRQPSDSRFKRESLGDAERSVRAQAAAPQQRSGVLRSRAATLRPPTTLHGGGTLVKPEGANNILELDEFRRGVGLCIYRSDGKVFAARRMDDPQQSWQMPQGGIDPLENPMKAALRELHEETSITSCRIVASIDHWLEYTSPTKVKAHHDSSWLRYRGQTQKWFLLHFHGDDSEIDLSCHGHPEFSEYSWQDLEQLPGGVVDFKQGVYRQVARHFAPEILRRVAVRA